MNKLIIILGPTGVGKTETSLSVAEYFHIPIINADSRQIYKGIPIGTAAPTPDEQKRVKHYMTEVLNIGDYYNASMFENDVLNPLNRLYEHSNIALMSGGSMMYIDAVCYGMGEIPTVSDEIRNEMKRRLSQEGLEKLCQELKELDPEYYEIVDKKNYRRVVHALEIIHTTGKPFSSFRTGEIKERPFDIIKIGLNRPREILYERINRRVDRMIAEGLVEEARKMNGLRSFNALNTVGYKELFNYFDGVWDLEEAIERIKGNTRRYCRKQLTWFKKDKDTKWFDLETNNVKEIINYIVGVV